MYTLTDSAFSSGSVGVGMYKGSTASTTFSVDWAMLSQFVSGALSASISSEQQALNEAGKNIPSDQITIEEYKYIQP